MKPGYSHLSLDERIEIEKRYDRGESGRTIAGALSRSPATISRELGRGRWRPFHENASYTVYRDPALHGGERTQAQYRAARAHRKAQTRGARSHQRTRLCSDEAITYLITKLRDGWTPEMIAGRSRIEFPDTPAMHMSHETIYRFIYARQNRHRRLYEYLPRGRKKRRKHHGRRVHSSKIPNRVSIRHRPPEIDARTVFGHWEGDSVLGVKSRGDGIHTEVERHSRMMMATKVEALTSQAGVDAQKRPFGPLPEHARVSTTMDNGTEMHRHTELVTDYGMDTYFADPYSSYQRGTNEHHNGRLRRYYPKGTDFSHLSEAELQAAVTEINNQPRKCLGWFTPAEAFDEHLHSETTDQCCTSN
ncbi:IS30 family transposase [Citricoccus muralis]|uniref:IS30 family transposase n=1 Tax=Citricoccus muralis TaxID=169134 RepID=A0ABY8H4X8_9MICC|nr:IS30 family transposase [Citricoccus muralis]WFP16193.1 IS30 family transposase [Citricoccus muralis]